MTGNSDAIDNSKIKSFYNCISDILTLEFMKSSKPRIAILRLCGVIGKAGFIGSKGLSLEDLNDRIEEAFSCNKLEAVCLIINSPGGSPVQSELIAKRIITLSKSKKIPVYSFVEDVAASGGYWLACAGSKIFASKNSIIGSIGVISSSFGLQEAINKIGIERRIYTSGKNKSILDPFMPAKESDIELIKTLQSTVHAHFIEYVKTRRSGKITQDDDLIFNGEFWAGDIALDYGLIDGIDDVYSFISNEFGDKVKIEYIKPKESWIKRKLSVFAKIFAEEISSEMKQSVKEISISNKYTLE